MGRDIVGILTDIQRSCSSLGNAFVGDVPSLSGIRPAHAASHVVLISDLIISMHVALAAALVDQAPSLHSYLFNPI